MIMVSRSMMLMYGSKIQMKVKYTAHVPITMGTIL